MVITAALGCILAAKSNAFLRLGISDCRAPGTGRRVKGIAVAKLLHNPNAINDLLTIVVNWRGVGLVEKLILDIK